MFNEFHFLRPIWLIGLAPLGLLLWRLSRGDGSTEVWRDVCDAHLLPFLLVGSAIQRRWWLRLIGFAWLICIIALAGPTWSKLEQPIYKGKSARVILLDLSLSMDAQDLKPSRLTRARYKVLDILEDGREGQAALIVYAQDAFVVSPLTDDANTIAALVPVLTTQIMPLQGSRLARALRKADELLEQAGVSGGEIVVVTDGVSSFDEVLEMIKEVHSNGRQISILGTATSQGAPVPLLRGGILKDADGAIVIPKLDTRALDILARAGGGRFSQITSDDTDLTVVLATSGGSWFDVADATQLKADQWREDGVWLVLLLLPLACLAFRRGWVLSVLFVLGLTTPPPLLAFDWKTLWSRVDQQGAKELDAGNSVVAAALFEDPQWKAAAHYRSGMFDLALAGFAGSDSADAHYNRGNALARLGDIRNAITAYDVALERDQNHTDALHNKTVLEKFLHQLEDAADGGAPRHRPQGESASSSTYDRNGQGGEGEDDDEIARREEESEELQERIEGDADEDFELNFDEQFSLNELQGSRYTPSARSGTQAADDPSLQALDDPSEGGASRNSSGNTDDRPTNLTSEELQALEQWLRRIPDDPGALLRRKLILEYRRRQLAGDYERSTTPW